MWMFRAQNLEKRVAIWQEQFVICFTTIFSVDILFLRTHFLVEISCSLSMLVVHVEIANNII